MDKPFEEVLDEVRLSIKWYYNNSKGASIDLLMDERDKLSCNAFFLTEELTTQINDYKTNDKLIETGITRDKLILEKNYATNKARDLAKNSYKTQIQQLAITDAIVKKIEKILKAVDTVLQAMQQRIAWERTQWEYQKKIDEYQNFSKK